jgi:2-amino-4-hydroxy-6-hydroxymethyldihydropteridine diphosphokinase
MTRVAIGFGSNLGDREAHISEAVRLLERAVAVDGASSLYETEPMYVESQPAFLNGVVVGETDLGPISLVAALKRIEAEVGRTPTVRNGPREIDLDLLLYGQLVLSSTGARPITVPHPAIAERRFVLEPLWEAWPEAFVPQVGPVEALLSREDVQSQAARRIPRAAVPLSGSQQPRP